ncbi:putative NRPS-like protein biosynthetic cluster [Aspergillus niger]|nr:putative NRPS-like protein biosynthetic cluster [Aspergillus niger]
MTVALEQAGDAGRRLLASLVDQISGTNPTRVFAVIPKGASVSDGFCPFTVGELAQAVNYTARWIEDILGRPSRRETLAYMATNDVRYFIFVLACNKTGYRAFLPSTRNSSEAFIHLLNATHCRKFVCSPEKRQTVLELSELSGGLQISVIPSLGEMLGSRMESYDYLKNYDEEENETCAIIHSSGTTGLPKPVSLTHGYIGVMDRIAHLPCPEGRKPGTWEIMRPNALLLSTTPFFHMMGLYGFILSIFHHTTLVIMPDGPVNPDRILDVIDAVRPTAALISPSILEEMSSSDRALRAISRLECLYFGGAPLSEKVGDQLCKLTNLATAIGSSEAGLIPSLAPLKRGDWKYFEWNPFSGVTMQPLGDEMYEMVIQRGPSRDYQGIFHTYPELQSYHTKDVFMPSPTNCNLWRYYGRIDDVIVLSNSEKFNPITMEKVVEGHPLVHSAIIAGQGQFQASLLVEPDWNKWDEGQSARELIEAIWPIVQQANKIGPAHGRILKSKIAVASQKKPFKKTAKGSTQRHHVYRDYAEDIAALYSAADSEQTAEIPKDTALHSMIGVLQKAVKSRLPEADTTAISTQQIYAHSTIKELASFLVGMLDGETNGHADNMPRKEKINTMVRKYTDGLPLQQIDLRPREGGHTVLLTGSTGSLGCYILDAILNDPATVKVYCMNRSVDAESRQQISFLEKGLEWCPRRQKRVEFLFASFGQERMGLGEAKYEELIKSVDTIVHNAWKVDFNHSLSSFEDVHIRGVRNMVEFSLRSQHHAHLHFVSSISTVGAWSAKNGKLIPETLVQDPDVTLPQGYGESKHVAERICATASERAGVPTTILRVGQVAGPTSCSGVWNRQEWLPTLIATSKSTGRIPTSLGSGPVNWIPVDTLATIILELIEARRASQSNQRCATFNLVNPSAATWSSLIPAVQRHFTVTPVELATWVHDLEAIKDPSETEFAAKPALKLLEFFQGLARDDGGLSWPLELSKTKEASATMRTLGPIDQPMLENWLRQWGLSES